MVTNSVCCFDQLFCSFSRHFLSESMSYTSVVYNCCFFSSFGLVGCFLHCMCVHHVVCIPYGFRLSPSNFRLPPLTAVPQQQAVGHVEIILIFLGMYCSLATAVVLLILYEYYIIVIRLCIYILGIYLFFPGFSPSRRLFFYLATTGYQKKVRGLATPSWMA